MPSCQGITVQKLMALVLNSQLVSLFGNNNDLGTAHPAVIHVEAVMNRMFSWTEACGSVMYFTVN